MAERCVLVKNRITLLVVGVMEILDERDSERSCLTDREG